VSGFSGLVLAIHESSSICDALQSPSTLLISLVTTGVRLAAGT
jgi:hypothetical protein